MSPAVEIIRASKVYSANGNLDSASAETVLQLLQRISREMGHTVLMATHSREAAEFASRALQMRDGCLLPGESR